MSLTPRLSRRLLAVMAVAGLALAACSKPAPTAATGEMTMGDPKAKVKMTEYASVTCPHCAAFAEGVLPEIKRKYIDTGKVEYTFREILTAPSEVAAAGFLTARCAGKDKYFTVVDAIFKAQPEMFSGAPPLDVLRRIGKENGLSDKQFEACINDKAALAAIGDRVDKNSREGEVEGTPTFVINGKKVKDGEMSLAEFEAFYNEALNAPAAAPAPAK